MSLAKTNHPVGLYLNSNSGNADFNPIGGGSTLFADNIDGALTLAGGTEELLGNFDPAAFVIEPRRFDLSSATGNGIRRRR
jgi:hypothetical protein